MEFWRVLAPVSIKGVSFWTSAARVVTGSYEHIWKASGLKYYIQLVNAVGAQWNGTHTSLPYCSL